MNYANLHRLKILKILVRDVRTAYWTNWTQRINFSCLKALVKDVKRKIAVVKKAKDKIQLKLIYFSIICLLDSLILFYCQCFLPFYLC